MITNNQANLEWLKGRFPARSRNYLSTLVRQPGYAFKIRTDLERLEPGFEVPWDLFPKEEPFRLSDDAGDALKSFAALVPNYIPNSKNVVSVPKTFLSPVVKATRTDTEAIMSAVGWKFMNGYWVACGHTIDLVRHRIDDKALMSASAAITPTGHSVWLDRDTTMYMVVSLLIRYAKAEPLSGMESAAIRETIARMDTLFDSDKLGYADEQRKAMVLNKTAPLHLKFDSFGWGLDEIAAKNKDKGLLYHTMSHKIVGMGGHAQGKYFIPMSSVGIYVADSQLTSPMGVKISNVFGNEDLDNLNVEAIVGSTDLAKWFKRLTIGALQTARLLKPEVGFMKVNGHTQEGVDVQMLVVKGGIPLPFKGGVISLKTRKEMGKKFAHYREFVHRDRVPGELTAIGHQVGTAVKKDDTLAQIGSFKILAKREGVVLSNSRMVIDGETHVTVNVGTVDTTGQLKGRSNSGEKWSMHYSDWTACPWHVILPSMGMEKALVHGDVAIFGLKDGDDPWYINNEDSLKATGKGLAMGRVNMAAQTLKREIDYRTEQDHAGAYNALVTEFEAAASRKVVTFHSVDEETFELVAQAITEKIVHPGVSVFQFTHEGRVYHIVRQEADALVANTLVKVESMPVADNMTKQRTPGEFAVALDGQGQNHIAEDLMRGSEVARAEYAALQRAAWSIFGLDPSRPYTGIAQSESGSQVVTAAIDILAPSIPKEFRARLQELTETADAILKLKTPIIIGAFDAEGNAVPSASREQDFAVLLDPVVLNSFGGGDDESSIETLARQLCWEVANEASIKEIERTILRLRGAMQTAAKAESVAKQRLNRGAWGVQCRRRAGFVPSGWVAVSYYGKYVRLLARVSGWNGEGHPADFMAGRMAMKGRSPQSQSTPQRVWIADAPSDAVAAYKLMGNWPGDAPRFGTTTGDTLEPHTVVNSPLAISDDNGDVDGDGELHTVLENPKAVQQALDFDWRSQRKTIFTSYMTNPKDPAVYAYEHDAKKLVWAKTMKTTVDHLTGLTAKSIRNQTLHIGVAHAHGHAMLVMCDLIPGRGFKAQALMFGHYEEQLAGLDSNYFDFYENLGRKRELGGAKWEAMMLDLNRALGESKPGARDGHTKEDWEAFKAANQIVEAFQFCSRNGDLAPIMLNGNNYRPFETALVVAAGVYRCISKGQLGHPFIRFVVNSGIIEILDHTRPGCLVVKMIRDFFREVYPEAKLSAFPGGDLELL